MEYSGKKQRGFAMPAMFVAVFTAFAGSLGVKGQDGTTVAQAMGLQDSAKRTEFAAVEEAPQAASLTSDE